MHPAESNIPRIGTLARNSKGKLIAYQRRSPCPSDDGVGEIDGNQAQSSSDDSPKIEPVSGELIAVVVYIVAHIVNRI